MKSLWNDKEARKCKKDPLQLRVYTSRLLGANQDLVMHGGGNTSVKIKEQNIFGEEEELLYVKGSGWDLATIEPQGFAPVKMRNLLQMAELKALSDMDMVKYQRIAMTDPSAPNPSVEAVLHAIIPYKFVDHSHTDAVVTVTNTPGGKEKIEEIYGERILIIPYVMPGFILAKKIYQMTRSLDWKTIEGMVLLNHGLFTFHDDARVSYENHIKLVSQAERYISKNARITIKKEKGDFDLIKVARTRKEVSALAGSAFLAKTDSSTISSSFSHHKKLKQISNRGPITPDHIIRTKRAPAILDNDILKDLEKYAADYQAYFQKHEDGSQVMLDAAPRWAIMPGKGSIYFGPSLKHINIIQDIAHHTQKTILQAEHLGGWKPLSKARLFEMEYWSLEQAKLGKGGSSREFQGKVALVTGAASGIGKACVEALLKAGAVVVAVDINPDIKINFDQKEVLSMICDVTNERQLNKVLEETILNFGGLDMIVSNAGIFPRSAPIAEMDEKLWNKSLELNVSSHQRLLQHCIPYLELGIDPAVVLIASKNVPAPGPGAAAYSVAKAGLTQLGRVAAMELGSKGIRVNMVHPNAVYDTAIWTDEVLRARAKHYGLTVDQYKRNNILKTEVTSHDVARLTVSMLGRTYGKVTGAQVPIDGGNERVI